MPIFIYSKGQCSMEYQIIIKKLRVQNFYTQQDIADKLDIGQRTYADYELRLYTNTS